VRDEKILDQAGNQPRSSNGVDTGAVSTEPSAAQGRSPSRRKISTTSCGSCAANAHVEMINERFARLSASACTTCGPIAGDFPWRL